MNILDRLHTGLDFLSLISTVNAAQKGSNTHSDKVLHKESTHTNQVPVSSLGLPNSELRFIDKCGHAPMMEQPQEFNRVLANFLQTHIEVTA